MRIQTFAIGLALLSLTAFAAEPTPRGAPGPAGPGLVGVLVNDNVHAALNLSAEQEISWTALKTAADALQTKRESTRQAMQNAIDAEFAKSSPDLLLIEDARLDTQETDLADERTLFATVSTFYQSLSSTQQAAVITAIRTMRSNPPPRLPIR
jgi:hypothetical protein